MDADNMNYREPIDRKLWDKYKHLQAINDSLVEGCKEAIIALDIVINNSETKLPAFSQLRDNIKQALLNAKKGN